MSCYSQEREELLRELQTDRESGLVEEEALSRRQKFGENKLREKKKKPLILRFLNQFKDVMILILIAAAAVSFTLVCIEKDWGGLFEPLLILLIVVLNAVMGVYQEGKAEKALDALKNMSAPHARVVRGGKERVIEAKELVPGDVILLEAGDFVPADARLLQSSSLKCEESALTGESVPAEKDAEATVKEGAPLGDRKNMVYSGCSVSLGTARAVVTAIGMDTEMGKIANLLEGEGEGQTPLQQKLAQLGKYLGIMALAACGIIFIVGLAFQINVLEIFMTAVSLAVSAIPEGLPAIVTIVLAIGVQRMVKKNALIRRLPAVETLGSASVICSDKTGTLTQNRMTLKKAYLNGEQAPEEIGEENSQQLKQLLLLGTLCCDGSIAVEEGKVKHLGDPTETAIVYAAYQNGYLKEELNKKYPRLAEIPFDSERKLMTSINRIGEDNIAIVKGAFDMMKPRCVSGDLEAAEKVLREMSESALRVLAIGYRKLGPLPQTLNPAEIETELNFLGLVGMIDPPREEVKAAVAVCKDAGIRPVMITGDHIVTASAIAKDLGILREGDRAMTGSELDSLTDGQLDTVVEDVSVYARVSPENKIRIVKAWQRKGQVVAMTGDGVNDAPALKAADIGCAMGITGTDVAKGAADMTLTDDNFATIVDAVREGRGIYANIKKVVGYLLGTNIGEVFTVFVAMLIFRLSPLLSMQLLWINLVTDSFPAIALGMEAVERDVMQKKPKPKQEGIFSHGFGVRIVLQGAMFAALTLVGFFLGQRMTGSVEGGRTMAFMTLSLSQIVQAFNMRSERSLFAIGPFGNHKLDLAALVSAALVALVLFTPLNRLFALVYLRWELYLIALGLIFAPLFVMECSKAVGCLILKRRKRRQNHAGERV